MIYRFAAIAFIAVLLTFPATAGPAVDTVTKDKVRIYSSLASVSEPEDAERYIDLMEDAARQAGDRDGVMEAMYKRAMLYYVAGTLEQFMEAADKVRPLLFEAKDDRYVFTEIFVIKRLLAEGRNETASRTAQDFLDIAGKTDSKYWEGYAYYGIGLTYHAGNYMDKSAASMEKGFSILSADGHIESSELVRIAFDLIELLIEKMDYGKAIEYGHKTERILQKMETDVETPIMKMYLFSSMAICYVQTGQLDHARGYLSLAESSLIPEGGLDNQQYNKAAAMYFLAVGDYDKALCFAQQCEQAYSNGNWRTFYIDALDLKSKILAASGKTDSAYTTLKEVERLKDSLASEQLAIQLSEFYTLYEVDRLEAKRQKQRIVIIMTGTLCLLLFVAVTVFVIYSHRLNRKNISLYNSIQENLRKEEEQSRIRQFVSMESVPSDKKLYYSLCRVMEDEGLFKDPNLKRGILAQRLGTNEKYLADAVKEGSGMTVTGFVAEYRLNYSVSIMSSEPELPLETVAEMSGFGAYSSFFRTFSKKFGMTPLEYRKYMKRKS